MERGPFCCGNKDLRRQEHGKGGTLARFLSAGQTYVRLTLPALLSSCFPSPREAAGAQLPESIQDGAVGEEADEPVSHCDFMEEGLLGLHNVRVRHPEELHEAGIQSDALVTFKHQPLVRPALSEVDGGCVVLREPRVKRDGERKILKSEGVRPSSYLHLGPEYSP